MFGPTSTMTYRHWVSHCLLQFEQDLFSNFAVVLSRSKDVHVIWMLHGFSIKMEIIYDDYFFPNSDCAIL